jgi:glutamyl-tRNA reductase
MTKSLVQTVLPKRKNRPLFLVDIASPRNLDPAINNLDNVFLYDIDDLEGIVETNLEIQTQEAEKINLLIEQEVTSFKSWISILGFVPLMVTLR